MLNHRQPFLGYRSIRNAIGQFLRFSPTFLRKSAILRTCSAAVGTKKILNEMGDDAELW
jgi:hypothetical protein